MVVIGDDCKDGNWFLYFGALSHNTLEVDNLFDPQEYSSTKFITIGNDLGLSISHIGTTMIKIENDNIPLRNILCVPHLKMILISIQFMSKDLNCSFYLKRNQI